MIDMHIRRGDVRCRDFRQQVVRDCDAAPLRPRLKLSELLGRDVRRLGQETRLGQMEATRGVYRPWPDQLIGVGKPNVAALMVGEIEVVVAKPTLNPIGVRIIDGPWILTPILGCKPGATIGLSSNR